MKTVSIFYSWQSDRPSKIGRNFVRRALDAAVEILRIENSIELTIDSDTQGVPGTPPITETVLKKIGECDLFLGDMTFVGQTESGKLLPNPNVMGEYGYALRAKGTERILLVMNLAFGPVDALPFDLKHLRHPAGFTVTANESDSVRRTRRSALSKLLAEYIAAAVHHLTDSVGDTPVDELEAANSLWHSAVSGPLNLTKPVLVSQPYATVQVIPFSLANGARLDLRKVKAARSYMNPDFGQPAFDGADETQWWSRGPTRRIGDLPNPEARWSTRLLQSGVMEWTFRIGERIDGDRDIIVEGCAVEAEVVNAVDTATKFFRHMDIDGNALIGASLWGMEDVSFGGGRRYSRRLQRPSIGLPTVVVPLSEQVGNHLQPLFDQLWLACGFDGGSPSFDSGNWAGYRNELPYRR